MLVHIPTLLINAQDGEDLLDQYRDHVSAGNGSELMLSADITYKGDFFTQSISYQLFYSSVSDLPMKFLFEMYTY